MAVLVQSGTPSRYSQSPGATSQLEHQVWPKPWGQALGWPQSWPGVQLELQASISQGSPGWIPGKIPSLGEGLNPGTAWQWGVPIPGSAQNQARGAPHSGTPRPNLVTSGVFSNLNDSVIFPQPLPISECNSLHIPVICGSRHPWNYPCAGAAWSCSCLLFLVFMAQCWDGGCGL